MGELRATVEEVRLHFGVVSKIKQHSKEQAAKGDYEAVGFVACKYGESVGVAVIPLHNHAFDPQRTFFVESWEQYRAEKKLEQQGYDVFGVYHSHVRSEALPSNSDHALARPGDRVFIYSVIFDDLKAYREKDGFLEPVELVVTNLKER